MNLLIILDTGPAIPDIREVTPSAIQIFS